MSAAVAEHPVAEFGAADVLESRIAENVSLAESPWQKMDVFACAPVSHGANNYETLLAELLGSGLAG